jgi:hypothetical protein
VKVEIRDPSVLRSLRPLEVISYLRSRGWEQTARLGDRGSVWSLLDAPEVEILLPHDRGLADFAARMADVLRGLSAAEDRSELAVLSDLTQAAHDVIRLRAALEGSRDGTIPLEAGAELVEHARAMMLAAASATAERRSYFPTRKPGPAVTYMSQVRLGQTEIGSYVVTLLSPVSPVLAWGPQPDLGLDDPFERRVVVTLARSLEAMREATTAAATTGRLDGFLAAVETGVTANLCDAIAGMTSGIGPLADLAVAISWSPSRPAEREPTAVRFGSDAAPVIQEAARLLRESAPIDDYRVLGLVVKLEQKPGQAPDRAWILSVAEETPRTVVMELEADARDMAIAAYKDRTPVMAVGRLIRNGPFFQLSRLRDFRTIPTPTLPEG